ncbi:endoplasmic reticulum membrane protein complex subunit 10 [[Candida] railenensis]|uniref:Endoplasmic reticulum membrane protein complex subunit 10 n=1 Tax=[Candida] railenensis TaxID=45579 RepID=A0A9P0QMP6_9ASCO|nr:endoplasmic reticulum membrane protein complex subunit 10 [[Candida] railenensis]
MYLPILLLISTVVADINIFANPLDGTSKINIGSIIATESNEFKFNQVNSLSANIDYCVGTEDLANHECFGYVEAKSDNGKLKLLVKRDSNEGTIHKISINPDINSEQDLIVVGEERGPSPILNPVHSQKQNAAKKGGVNSNAASDSGEAGEDVEEEVDNRSFVQKNWMYIVPGLLLLFMGLSPEEEKK